MPAITAIADFFVNVLKYHKMKIFIAFASTLVFLVLLFPYDDLGDLVTGQVSKLSQNKVFLQFDKMGLRFLPTISLGFDQVEIETPDLPVLKADSLSLAPSIPALLAFRAGANVDAEGLFSGDLDLGYSQGETLESGDIQQMIDLEFTDFRLENLPMIDSLPIRINGEGNLDLEATIDPGFADQPEGETVIKIRNLVLPPSTVPTQMGPLALPQISFSKSELRGRIVNGQFILEDSTFGSGKDKLQAAIKGKLGILFKRRGANVRPSLGSYEFKVQLDVSGQLPSELGLFASFIDKFKSKTNTGSRYLFKLNGANFHQPPKMTAIRSL